MKRLTVLYPLPRRTSGLNCTAYVDLRGWVPAFVGKAVVGSWASPSEFGTRSEPR